MTCSRHIERLVECARRGATPDSQLRHHLARCAGCGERWEAERALTDEFRVMQRYADAAPPRVEARRDAQRQALMAQFEQIHQVSARPSRFWMLSTAAAVLLTVSAGLVIGTGSKPGSKSPARAGFVRPAADASYSYEMSTDAGSLSSDDFIAVPYTAPLAAGEIVRVVREDLFPEALVSMGIDVNPAWSGEMPADVVVGEDGFPRAVRLADTTQN
jgi:hypothetical protein